MRRLFALLVLSPYSLLYFINSFCTMFAYYSIYKRHNVVCLEAPGGLSFFFFFFTWQQWITHSEKRLKCSTKKSWLTRRFSLGIGANDLLCWFAFVSQGLSHVIIVTHDWYHHWNDFFEVRHQKSVCSLNLLLIWKVWIHVTFNMNRCDFVMTFLWSEKYENIYRVNILDYSCSVMKM